MGVFNKVIDLLGFGDLDEMEYEEEIRFQEEIPEVKPKKNRANLVALNNPNTGKGSLKVVLLEPMVFDDCQQIADNLKNKRTVIINVESLEMHLARRIVDFVGGVAYALGGTLQKIGTGIIIAVPSDVDISGDVNLTQPKEVFAWINKLEQEELRRY